MGKETNTIQSRREFFKSAVAKALPVLGAIALMSSPIIAKAGEKGDFRMQYLLLTTL